MKDLRIDIKDNDGKCHGYIKAHIDSDMPEYCIEKLGAYIKVAFDKWQETIIKWDKGNGSQRT